MRPSSLTVVPVLLVLAAPAAGAQGFEGALTIRMQAERGMEIQQLIKGDKVRTEMGGRGQEGVMIMDGAAQTMMMIMPSEKMYMVMDLKAGAGGPGPRQGETPKITKLGTSETIAGRACDNFLVGDQQDMEVCAAKGLGFYMSGRNPMGGRSPMGRVPDFRQDAIMREYKDGFFPLRIVRLAGGKREVMMEVTRIEPKSLDAALFSAPAGYQQMSMPGGMPGRP
jgi:hypothetical protein